MILVLTEHSLNLHFLCVTMNWR